MLQPSEEEGKPIGTAFGQALIDFYTGPCSLGERCPIGEGKLYKNDLCMMDGCPRAALFKRKSSCTFE